MMDMPDMPMPGGWSMSMMWMRMPGQSWLGAACAFVAMWAPMMAVMMLPSLLPMLRGYRRAIGGAGARRRAGLTALVAAGYLLVWSAFGLTAFPAGAALAALEMQHPALARAVPIAVGVVVLLAGGLQLTAWKARLLACCRHEPAGGGGGAGAFPADAASAWRHGLRLGLLCGKCCLGPTAVLLAAGVMDLRAMLVVTAAVTAERVLPGGERIARALGSVALGAGMFMIARAAGIG